MGLTELKKEVQPLTTAEKAELMQFIKDLLAQEREEDAQDAALWRLHTSQAAADALQKLLKPSESKASEPTPPEWLKLEGSCRGLLSTVDEFIQRKAEEKRLER